MIPALITISNIIQRFFQVFDFQWGITQLSDFWWRRMVRVFIREVEKHLAQDKAFWDEVFREWKWDQEHDKEGIPFHKEANEVRVTYDRQCRGVVCYRIYPAGY